MATLITQMARKSRLPHDGYLPISSKIVDDLVSEVAAYCHHPDPMALASALRAGHCQMFGIPIRVQD